MPPPCGLSPPLGCRPAPQPGAPGPSRARPRGALPRPLSRGLRVSVSPSRGLFFIFFWAPLEIKSSFWDWTCLGCAPPGWIPPRLLATPRGQRVPVELLGFLLCGRLLVFIFILFFFGGGGCINERTTTTKKLNFLAV